MAFSGIIRTRQHFNGKDTAPSSGFTLIELSVVLLVIALVIAGIVVGRDLVRLAEIRAQITQIEKYNAAVNTFRNKYNGLPGDLAAAQAAAVGFKSRSGAAGHGDGNGLLEGCERYDTFSTNIPIGCEVLLFWSDLGDADLIDQDFPLASDNYLVGPYTVEDTHSYFPVASITQKAVLLPISCTSSGAWYHLNRFYSNGPGMLSYSPPLFALDAQALDSKMDDGDPLAGSVLVRANGSYGGNQGFFCQAITQSSSGCVYQNAYNVTITNYTSCNLHIKIHGL